MRKALSVLIAIFIAIPLLFAASALMPLNSLISDGKPFEEALSSGRIVEALGLFLSVGGPGMEKGRMEIAGMEMDSKAFAAATVAALPKEEYDATLKAAVGMAMDALGGKRVEALDLRPLKYALSANAGEFASRYIDALPPGEEGWSVGTFTALPEGMTAQAAKKAAGPFVEKAWRQGVDLALADSLSLPEGFAARVGNPRKAVASALALCLAFGLCALAGGAFLSSRLWSGRLVHAGTVIIVSSVPAFLVGISASAFGGLKGALAFARDRGWLALDLNVDAAVLAFGELARNLAGIITRPFLVTGIAGLVLGLLLISLRWAASAREL